MRRTNKTEIIDSLMDELECPEDFITRLDEAGYIDRLVDAAMDDNDGKYIFADIMKDIRDEYKSYCKVFDLSY